MDVFPEPGIEYLHFSGERGFNPCFSGCLSRTRNIIIENRQPRVSILVLVDVFPERGKISSSARAGIVSILVLVDVFPEHQFFSSACFSSSRFQSLF